MTLESRAISSLPIVSGSLPLLTTLGTPGHQYWAAGVDSNRQEQVTFGLFVLLPTSYHLDGSHL